MFNSNQNWMGNIDLFRRRPTSEKMEVLFRDIKQIHNYNQEIRDETLDAYTNNSIPKFHKLSLKKKREESTE